MADVKMLADEMKSGSVGVLIVCGINPAQTLPASLGFVEGMAKVGTTVTTGVYRNETANLSTYTCPDSHYLESWSDANPAAGKYSLAQPVISKLYDTRQHQESLMAWSGQSGSYLDFIKSNWSIHMGQDALSFETLWNKTLHDGIFEIDVTAEASTFAGDVQAAASNIKTDAGSGCLGEQ